MNRVAVAALMFAVGVAASSAARPFPCGGPALDAFNRFAAAFGTGNESLIRATLAANFTGMATNSGCKSDLSRDEFMDVLLAKYFQSWTAAANPQNRRMLFPTLSTQGLVTGAVKVNVFGFAPATPADSSKYFVDEAVMYFETDSDYATLTRLVWLTPEHDANASLAVNTYWQLMNASQVYNPEVLNATYADDLEYYPALCGTPYPPFGLDKQAVMKASAANFANQQFSISATDFVYPMKCGYLAASFMNLFVGGDGRQMALKDFDIWRLVGNGNAQVDRWWEFGLMSHAPAA